MQGNVPPVAHNAGTLFAPGHAPLTGEVVPMERLNVEVARRPAGKPVQNIALSDERIFSTRAVSRLGKVVFEIEVGANAYEEHSAPVLGNSKVLRV